VNLCVVGVVVDVVVVLVVLVPLHNESYTKAKTIHMSGANDFVKAEH